MQNKKEYIEKKVAMSETTYNGLNKLSAKRKSKGEVIHKNKDIIAKFVADAVKKEFKS
jgi:hypothetical protein